MFRISMLLILLPLLAGATSLRLEGDHAWLEAEGAPLPKVLRLFEERGVEVLIDPSLELGRVSGNWEDAKVDRLIQQLVAPNSYLLEWKRMEGPLGELFQISSIRIFSDGKMSAARPLSPKQKLLDVVEGASGKKYIRSEILVGFAQGTTLGDLKALLSKLGGTVIEVIDPPGLYRIKLNDNMSVEEALELALAQKGVRAAQPNLAFENGVNEPVALPGAGTGINLQLQPGETAIAVFDSGLDPRYADLSVIRGTYDAINPDAEISDPTGHGTLVALVASGVVVPVGSDPAQTGVPVLAVRVFDENGMTSSTTVMQAINFAIDSGVGIINMSFGTYDDIGFIESAVEYATAQGVVITVAAGNDGLDKSTNPAASPATLSIGATNPDGSIADYSNRGSSVNTYETGTVEFNGKLHYGTSFASPRAAYDLAVQK